MRRYRALWSSLLCAAVASGPVLATVDDWREALAEARRRAEAHPGDPVLDSLLGEALLRAGRFDEAAARIEPHARASRATARGYMTLGRVREAEGRAAEAIAWMQAAVAADPQDPEVLYRAAGATETRAQAIELLDRYLASSEGDDEARIEAARSSRANLAALGDRPVWLDVERPAASESRLQAVWNAADGSVAGWVIDAEIGPSAKRVPLLLDSGSSGLVVISRVARKRGFEPLAEQTLFGGGGAGRHATERGFFSRLALGELSFSDVLATVAPMEMDPTGRFQGLVGLSAFNGYEVTLDFAAKRLRLRPPSASQRGEPYWIVAGQWLVEVRLGSAAAPALFLLDTGATRTLVDSGWVRFEPRARVGRPVDVAGFGGGLDARELSGVDIVYQGISPPPGGMRAVDLSARSQVGGVEIAGCLGLDALGGRSLVIDTVKRRVALVGR